MTAAYSLLVNFKPPKQDERRRNPRRQEPAVEEEDGISFMQAGGVITGADGVTHTHVTCFRCEHKGHYANKCPNGPNATLLQTEAAAAVTLLQASHTKAIIAADNTNPVSDFTFTQLPSRHELIPSSWVLLDSQSTLSVFKNPNFLTNIRRGNSQLKVTQMAAPRFRRLLATSRILGLPGTIPTLWPTSSLSPPFASSFASQWTRLLKLPSACIVLTDRS